MLEQSSRGAPSPSMRADLDPAPTTGDETLLDRLAANLIDNAIEHTVVGGRIDVSTSIDGAHAQLTVANDGPQISLDEAERLFEPFHRGAATRTADGRTHAGLGLSIVRAIATAHGGTVTAHPRVGGGLRVTFLVPH